MEQGGMRIIKNPKGVWFSGNDTFWLDRGSSAERAGDLDGEWPAVGGKDRILRLCDLERLIAAFELDADDTDDTIEVGEVEEIGGINAVGLTGQDGKERVTARWR